MYVYIYTYAYIYIHIETQIAHDECKVALILNLKKLNAFFPHLDTEAVLVC